MTTRLIAVTLWYLAGWSVGEVGVVLFDLPAGVAIVPGILLGNIALAFAAAASLGIGRQAQRRVRPIEELAAELDKRNGAWGAATAEERQIR